MKELALKSLVEIGKITVLTGGLGLLVSTSKESKAVGCVVSAVGAFIAGIGLALSGATDQNKEGI